MSADNVKGNRGLGFLQTVRTLVSSVASTEQGQDMAAKAVTAGLGLLAKGLDRQADRADAKKATTEATDREKQLRAQSAGVASVFTAEGQLQRGSNVRPTAPEPPKTFESQLLDDYVRDHYCKTGETMGIPASAQYKETPKQMMERELRRNHQKAAASIQALESRLANLEAQEQSGAVDESHAMQKAQIQDVLRDAKAIFSLPVPSEADWKKSLNRRTAAAFQEKFGPTFEAADALLEKRSVLTQNRPDAEGDYRHMLWPLVTLQYHLVTTLDRVEQMTRPGGPPNPMMGGMGMSMMGQQGGMGMMGGMMPGMFPGMMPGMFPGMMPGINPGAPVSPAEAERMRDRDLAKAQAFAANAGGPSSGYSGPSQAELAQQDWLTNHLNSR